MNASHRPLLRLFFLSGVASLGYELVFTKLLGYIFGITAYATSTVLACFMGGLALGSAIISRYADRLRRPLRLYALVELLIGAYMLAVPSLLALVRAGYVGLNRATPLSLAELNLVRFLLGGAVVLLPSALMGATLPLLARHFVRSGHGADPIVARLYATNTFGAAAGVIAANYLLLPWTGIYGALGAGALVNLYVGLRALRLQRTAGVPAERAPPAEPAPPPAPAARLADRGLLLVALLTGLVAFSYEVVWTHLLAVVVGSSAYAFGDMLLAFLLGIAGGSAWLARHPAQPGTQLLRLGRCQLGVGIAVVATLPLWDRLPLLFQLIGYLLPGFYVRETVRLAASLTVMLIPTCLMGVSFPLLIDALRGGPLELGRRIGRAYALNTGGAILGATLTGFVLLPALGSRLTLLTAAGLSMALGAGLLWLARSAERPVGGRAPLLAGLVLLTGFVALPHWDYQALVSGSNVYFAPPPRPGRIVFVHEDVQSGVTSVQERPGRELELRTNGKGEGNNRGQMEAQWGFALIPALLSHRWERAAVIGLGTGVTAGTLARFPYQRIDVAELSPGIVAAARGWFSDVNGGVLDDPRVTLHLEDGRNLLLLAEQARYDLITIEITSIWFAGAANLYSRNFFELVRNRLAPGGVFQQWVQFHHSSPLDILRILNTLRQVFPHVTLWQSGTQGMLVASLDPLRADYATVLRFAASPAMGPVFDSLPLRHPLALFGDLLLDEAQVDSAIGFVSRRIGPRLTRRFFISSDLYPWLEYSTPRGNAQPMQYGATLKFFENYDAHGPPPIDGIPPADLPLVYGLAALQKGNPGNALRLLERAALQRPDDPGLAALVTALRRRVETRPL
ncbi:MAG TPA: fused MFS/spermidine synthase [Gemmatimonadales bacterium]|nr:fused MFS/spermidine synthase [Gemmatimonadales bacterium]